MPKFDAILQVENEFLREISSDGTGVGKNKPIEISSYNPLPMEMNIFPVIAKLLENPNYKLNHSLPISTERNAALTFREYSWGDDLVKSKLFSVFEPSEDKK